MCHRLYWRIAAVLVELALILLLGFVSCAVAQEPTPTQGALSDSVWYDADLKKTVPVSVRDETQDSVNRDSRWLPKAKRVPKPAKQAPAANTTSGLFGTSITPGVLLAWTFVLALIIGVVAAFVYAVSNASFDGRGGSAGRKNGTGEGPIDNQTLERVKHLPAELRRTDVNMRDEAKRLMQAGMFDQAIILLFGHQLLLLDRAGMLRLNRSKTNGKYIRETRAADDMAAHRLRQTADSFERSYFGRHAITSDEFARLWTLNEALEADIVAGEGVAA